MNEWQDKRCQEGVWEKRNVEFKSEPCRLLASECRRGEVRDPCNANVWHLQSGRGRLLPTTVGSKYSYSYEHVIGIRSCVQPCRYVGSIVTVQCTKGIGSGKLLRDTVVEYFALALQPIMYELPYY
jgi:hypothetical protein